MNGPVITPRSPNFIQNKGCLLWLLVGLILGGLAMWGMKKGLKYSESMFGEIKLEEKEKSENKKNPE